MFKKLMPPVVIGGALLASLAVGGVANAATPTANPAVHAGTHNAHKSTVHRKLRMEALKTSATTIGISPQTLWADLKTGKSISQVASANGSSAGAVESALVSAADQAVNKAQASGRITSTQASTLEARIPARIDRLVNHVF
jgi:hypothetical protein